MEWIAANLGTIVVGLVLLIIVGLVVFKLVRDKKKGKSTCGCGCSNCAMKGSCHKK